MLQIFYGDREMGRVLLSKRILAPKLQEIVERGGGGVVSALRSTRPSSELLAAKVVMYAGVAHVIALPF